MTKAEASSPCRPAPVAGGGPGSAPPPPGLGSLPRGRQWEGSLPHRDGEHACVFLIKLRLLLSEEEGSFQARAWQGKAFLGFQVTWCGQMRAVGVEAADFRG